MKFADRRVDVKEVVPKEAPPWAKPMVEKLVGLHNDGQAQVREALNGGLSTVENTIADLKTVRVDMPATAPFVALTLASPWVASTADGHTPAICMFPGGRVRLRGAIKSGTPGTGAGGVFATAATGYRPRSTLRWATYGGASSLGLVQVDADGSMRFIYSAAGTPIGHLDCIDYYAESAAQPHAFMGTGWPMAVKHGFDARCRQVEVVECMDVDRQAGAAQGAPVVDWRDLGNGNLAIDAVWGLQWGRRYDLRLRLSPE